MKLLGVEYAGRSHCVDFKSKTDFTLRDHNGREIHSSGLPADAVRRIGLHHTQLTHRRRGRAFRRVLPWVAATAIGAGSLYYALAGF